MLASSGMGSLTRIRARLPDAAIVALIKLAASAIVIAIGARVVSDDDFARVTIAQAFARSPKLDPSGTSWLPLPFWVNGAWLAIAGRSLDAARASALIHGVVAALIVYAAALLITERRSAAIAGAAIAAIVPWSAKLGVATVPELLTASLVIAGAASLTQRSPLTRALGAIAITAACLSRYEAWPAAIAFAVITSVDAAREAPADRARLALAVPLALAGLVAWTSWNKIAHGDPFHYIARVTAYRRALGGGEMSIAARLAAYPIALVREEPEVTLAAIASIGSALRDAGVRAEIARFARPGALIAAQIALLAAAMVKDGAPTHHAERALLAAMLLAAMVIGAAVTASRRAIPWIVAAIAIGAIVRVKSPHEPSPQRRDEVAIGARAAALTKPGDRVLIEVDDYSYLAIIAALGRPEDAIPDRSIDPRQPIAPSSFGSAAPIRARVAGANATLVAARTSDAAIEALGQPIEVRGGWGIFRARGSN